MKEFHSDLLKIISVYGILFSNQRQDLRNVKRNITTFISHWFPRRKNVSFFPSRFTFDLGVYTRGIPQYYTLRSVSSLANNVVQ